MLVVGRQHTASKKDMFTIIPYGRGQALDGLNLEAADLLASVAPDAQLCEPGKRPFVELSYQEIPEEHIEQVLGYAGITKANAQLGCLASLSPGNSLATTFSFHWRGWMLTFARYRRLLPQSMRAMHP